MLDDKRLAEIEARCNAATPGPWRGDCFDGFVKYAVYGSDGTLVLRVDHKNYESGFIGERSVGDESFVLHAPTDVPALIAEVRSWHEAMARLRDMPMASVAPSLVEIGRWVCDDLTQSVPYYGDTPQEAIAKAHEEWRRGGVK